MRDLSCATFVVQLRIRQGAGEGCQVINLFVDAVGSLLGLLFFVNVFRM